MIRTSRNMRICVTLLVCNLLFIWGNSLLPGDISGQISDRVKEILEAIFPPSHQEDSPGGFLLRKLAHFTEFAVLGVLLSWLYGMLQKKKPFAFLCGAAAACIDETIQIFVPDRGPAIRDVLIDCSGVAAGMILMHLGYTWLQKKQQTHLEEIGI